MIGMMSKGEKIQISQPMITKCVPFDQIWEVRTPDIVSHRQDGVCSYTGPGDLSEDSIATVRAKVPIDPTGPLQRRSFELRIIHPGENRYIAVGVCSEAYPKNMLPGWEESSVGYHADNGNLFNSCGDGRPTDHPCKQGDAMKVIVNPVDGSQKEVCVVFHRNERVVGRVTTWTPEKGFYACFGMMSRNEKVLAILPEISIPYTPQKSRFQDVWEIATPNLQYRENGICRYVGEGGGGHVGTVRSKLPLNPFGSDNTFQVKILDSGRNCSIALGVCAKDYPSTLLPGWEDVSIGFHADNGYILESTVGEQPTSHPCRQGDVIKCTLEAVDGSEKRVNVVFHRNGDFVGKTIIWTPAGGLYAQVGAMGVGEVIQVASSQLEPTFLLHDAIEKVVTATPTQPLESGNHGGHFQKYDVSGGSQHMEGFVVEGAGPRPGGGVASRGGGGGATGGMFQAEHLAAAASVMLAAHGYHPYLPRHPQPFSFRPAPPYRHHRGYPPPAHHPYYHPYRHHHPAHGTPPSQRPNPTGQPPYHGSPGLDHGLRFGHEMGFPYYGTGAHPDASTASPLPVHQNQPPLTHSPNQLSGRSREPGPVYATQTSVMSSASEQEAFSSQISTESADSYSDVGGRSVRKSESYPLLSSGSGSGSSMHESGSFSTLESAGAFVSMTHHDTRIGTGQLPGLEEGSEGEATTPMGEGEAERVLRGTARGVPQLGGRSREGGVTHHPQSPFSPTGRGRAHVDPLSPKEERPGFASPGSPVKHARELNSPSKQMSKKPLGPRESDPSPDRHSVGSNYPDSPITPVTGGTFLPITDETNPISGRHTAKPYMYREPTDVYPSEQAPTFQPSPTIPSAQAGPAFQLPGTGRTIPSPQAAEGPLFQPSWGTPTIPSSDAVEAVALPSRPPPIVRAIPKTENKTFSILHNIISNSDGSLESSLPLHPMENAFIMSRLPLTEKVSYFEVELENLGHRGEGVEGGTCGNVAVGLVWSRYPPNQLPGKLQGSIAFHSINGTLYTGAGDCRKLFTTECMAGDVIGCRAHLQYKMEVLSCDNDCTVEVELFRNGCSVGKEAATLPPSGFHPAVGLTGAGTRVRVRRDITLTPDNYFKTHPLPDTYTNFPQPPPSPDPWMCIRNSKVSDTNVLSMERGNIGKPAVVQSFLPMTEVTPYFELELLGPVAAYTALAVGILPKLGSDSQKVIPGESPNSIGFLPLLGFVMRDGVISSAIPESITFPDRSTIGLGIDFHPHLPLSTSATSLDRKIKVFFTVNGQEVQSVLVLLPPRGGFHATVAVDSDSMEVSSHLVSLQFPKRWPCMEILPYGFARGPDDPSSIEVIRPFWVRDAGGVDAASDDSTVRAIQAAYPLSRSRSYFEMCIVHGGDNYRISTGLASFNYPLNTHPGWGKDSIAIHADDGRLFLNAEHAVVTAPCQHIGTVIGCGARFPEDGSAKFAEVFFTVDRQLIARRFVSVPPLGFFPTIGLRTVGAIVMLDMTCPDPYPDLQFNTSFAVLENVIAEGSTLQLMSHALPGAAQLTGEVSAGETNYFQISPISDPNGKIFAGYSTTKECPFTCKCNDGLKSYALEITSGMVLIRDQYFQINETASFSEGGRSFGCGIMPVPSSEKSLLFFTVDDQVIYCTLVDIRNFSGHLYPYVYILGSSTKVRVNACSLWPPVTPIGSGWARHANLIRKNAKILHSCTSQKPCKVPVGFAQMAMPLTPSNSYFEVEVCSRAPDKAIAVGLASKRYPRNTWVGWKNESIAYHLDDGRIFKGNGNFGHGFGPKVYAGHTVGCGIRFGSTDHSMASKGGEKLEVFFTLNGAVINSQKGTGSILKMAPNGGFFPTVCLESQSESVIVHRHGRYPSVSSSVGREWARAYSIHQAGRILEHSCRHKELCGAIPKAFCQAREPLSARNPYFEIEISGLSDCSQISAGVSKLIPIGSTSASTADSMMYSCSGQLVTRRSSQKTTNGTQKCVMGDKLGCALLFDRDQPTAIEFFLNNMKVLHLDGLMQRWRNDPLYPTIVLSHPGDAVVPTLGLALPEWDRSMLIGWLRSERVKLRSNVVEYSGVAGAASAVGVAQLSQPLQIETNPYCEVEILDPGMKCTITVGVAAADYPLSAQPGWSNNSVAYHGDDGRLFLACPVGSCFGPTWRKYDVIGVGVRTAPASDSGKPGSDVQVYFTRNGEELGQTTITVPVSGLFPIVGLQGAREKVKVQFCAPNSTNPACHVWRTLCGVKASRTTAPAGSTYDLTYWDNGRKTPACGFKLASAFAREPFSDTVQYVEIKVRSFGVLKAIAVGVVPKSYSVEQAPGWLEGSIAYHTDSGHLHYHSGLGKVFGPVGREGDTFGCGVSFIPNNPKNCSVFFTYNGMEIGRVRGAIPDGGLYPAVCLTARRDKVSVSFHETFKPRLPQTTLNFVGLMRINNCSYSNQIVVFAGRNGGETSPALAQFAVPLHTDRNYFATNIVKRESTILIGLAVRDYPMKYAPGYTSISVAYNVTSGSIRAVFNSESFHTIEAPSCEVGDTVGCGIQDANDSKSDFGYVYFTRNGEVVGTVQLVEVFEELYPVVGMLPGKGPGTSALFMNWNVPVYEPPNLL